VNTVTALPLLTAQPRSVAAEPDRLAQLRRLTWATAPEAMFAIAGAMGGKSAQRELLCQWGVDVSLLATLRRQLRQAARGIAESLGDLVHFNWSNSGETSLWDLVFQNTTFVQAPLIQGSSSAGSFFISLHTASPGAAGTQSTSEAAYTSYAREAVARTVGGWTITGNAPIIAENAAAVTFPAATGGSETETAFAFGQETSGAGVVYGYGNLSSSLAVSSGITPSFAIDAINCDLT
jgi:hypothetical protein